MKIFNAAIEVKMTHDGRYYLMVDSVKLPNPAVVNQAGEIYRSSGTSAEDLKDLAAKVGKLVVEALMEGR